MMIHVRPTLAFLALGALGALAASPPAQEPPAQEPAGGLRAYRAACIAAVAGETAAPGILLVRGNRVEAVLSADAELPEGAELIDLGGAWLMPGLVNPLSAISSPRRGYSAGRASQSGATPRDARQAVGLARVEIRDPLCRRLGSTPYAFVAILPSDSRALIEGHASVIRPCRGGEKDAKEICVEEKAYLFLSYGSGKTIRDIADRTIRQAAEAIIKEREEKKKAEEEAKKKAAEEAKRKAEEREKPPENKEEEKQQPAPQPPARAPSSRAAAPATAPKPPPPPDPLRLAFEGKLPVFIRAGSPAALDHLFAFIDSLPLPLRFTLVTGSQPPDIAEKIAARRDRIRAVILEPAMGREWETSVFVSTARLLLEKGVDVAFVPQSDTIDGFRDVLFHAAEMVKGGVREEDVIRALTAVPARLLGIERIAGSLAPGRSASFSAYDSDPLSGTARILRVFVEGDEVYSDDPATGELRGEALR